MRMQKQFVTFFTLVLVLFTLFPLGAAGQQESLKVVEPVVSIIDSRNAEISLFEYPQRIVSLSPNLTETLFALGLGDKVVGRSDYCDYPAEAASIPPLGDLFTPSVEKILSFEPDLVIIGSIGQAQTVEALETGGATVAYINEEATMEGTYRIIEQVGNITGASAQATALITEMKQTIEQVLDQRSQSNRPTVYYVAGFGEWGDFTATGDTFLHEIIVTAGGDNIAHDAINWSYQLEILLAKDPDILILPAMWGSTPEETKNIFLSHPSYASLSAVKNDKIITWVENNILERQGPRSALAVSQLAQAFTELSR